MNGGYDWLHSRSLSAVVYGRRIRHRLHDKVQQKSEMEISISQVVHQIYCSSLKNKKKRKEALISSVSYEQNYSLTTGQIL